VDVVNWFMESLHVRKKTNMLANISLKKTHTGLT